MRNKHEGEPVQVALCAPPAIKPKEPADVMHPENSRECHSLNEFREYRKQYSDPYPAPVFVRMAGFWADGVAIGAHSDDLQAPAENIRISGVLVRLASGSVLEVTSHEGIRWQRVAR